ncbi:MAG: glycosyltransferase [Gammaproteobacteria bacterium]|nr:glycosyltransferase [Gammaproteobacteria bacterium]
MVTNNTASVIVSTYNWSQALSCVLQQLSLQTCSDFELIIAEDSDFAENAKVTQSFKSRFNSILHLTQKDLGFRKTRILNRAARCASGEYLIFIDGDILVHPKFIEDHMRHMHTGRYLQGGRFMLNSRQTARILNLKKEPRFPFISSAINSISHGGFAYESRRSVRKGTRGCNFSVHKSDFLAVNGFDEQFKGWGLEDTELICRLINSGVRRYDLRAAGIALHMHHKINSRSEGLNTNIKLLEETINQNKIWTDHGLSQPKQQSNVIFKRIK